MKRNSKFIQYVAAIVVMVAATLTISCSDDKEMGEIARFETFSVMVNDQKIEATIDQENHIINIPNVGEGDKIYSIDYTLSNPNATIYPNAKNIIGRWGYNSSMNVMVVNGGSTNVYKMVLNDFIVPVIETLTVDITNKKQEILFIGGDMERSQGNLVKCGDPELAAKYAFGSDDIDFDICRVAYDKMQEMVEGVKTPEFYDNTIAAMKLLRKVNPDIEFWAVMKSDYNGYGKENNLPEWICDDRPNKYFYIDKYAQFLYDYLKLMQDNGVGIKYMATAKEWTQTVTAPRAKGIIEKLIPLCKAGGVEVPLFVDAATYNTSGGKKYVEDVAKLKFQNYYYGFSTHNLGTTGAPAGIYNYNLMVDAVDVLNGKGGNTTTKEMFHSFADETSGGGHGPIFKVDDPKLMVRPEDIINYRDAIMGIYREKCEMYRHGIEGELIFEMFSRNGGSENRAVSFAIGGKPYRFRIYYMVQQLVKGVKATAGKKYYVASTDAKSIPKGIYDMCFIDDEKLFMCIMNDNENDFGKAKIDLKGGTFGSKAEVTLFDINLPIEGVTTEIDVTDSSIAVDVSPYSVAFVTVPLADVE